MWEIFELLCRQKGVTSADVSRATGIGQSTLGNWKKRRNILNAKAAQKISEAKRRVNYKQKRFGQKCSNRLFSKDFKGFGL